MSDALPSQGDLEVDIPEPKVSETHTLVSGLHTIPYVLVNGAPTSGHQETNSFKLPLATGQMETDEQGIPIATAQVQSRIASAMPGLYWPLMPGYSEETLQEATRIILDENNNIGIDIYNFGEALTPEQLEEISETLAQFYWRLKDKSLFTLKSIQLRSQNEKNSKNGEFFRGKEWPDQKRFELFPYTLRSSTYRDSLNCSEVEGAVAHEATHVCLEGTLRDLWLAHQEELGWVDLSDQNIRVELPGGIITARVNNQYKNLATSYAGYQEDDDRAESVVAFLLDPTRLDSTRRAILENIFLNAEGLEYPKPTIENMPLQYPDIGTVNVYLSEMASIFAPKGLRRSPTEPEVISLEEYRRRIVS